MVCRSEATTSFNEVVQPPLEQLDVRQNALVQRDRNVVLGLLEVGLDCLFQLFRRGRRAERRRKSEQLVDRRRLVLFLGETVAGRERANLVGADPIDQTIEVLADARFCARAVRRFEQHVHCAVEFLFGRLDVSLLQLFLAGFEMRLGGGNQRENRILNRRLDDLRGRQGFDRRRQTGNRLSRLDDWGLRFERGAACGGEGNQRDEKTAPPLRSWHSGSSVPSLSRGYAGGLGPPDPRLRESSRPQL